MQSGYSQDHGEHYEYDPSRSPSERDKSNANETFVFKLYRLIEDQAHRHLISWGAQGTSFVIHNPNDFSKDVLPKYFKHNNFSSFVRQLNMYGFHKINDMPRSSSKGSSDQNHQWEFSHPKFMQGRPDLLTDIKRRVVSGGSGGSGGSSSSGLNRSFSEVEGYEQMARRESELLQHIYAQKVHQKEMQNQIQDLHNTLNHLIREISEGTRRYLLLSESFKKMIEMTNKQNVIIYGNTAKMLTPQDFGLPEFEERPVQNPSIFISPSPGEMDYANDPYQRGIHQAQMFPVYGSIPQIPPILHSNDGGHLQRPVPVQYFPSQLDPNAIQSRGRSNSHNQAINTPLPPSPIISPVGSPVGSSIGSPLSDYEDDYMDGGDIKPEQWGAY